MKRNPQNKRQQAVGAVACAFALSLLAGCTSTESIRQVVTETGSSRKEAPVKASCCEKRSVKNASDTDTQATASVNEVRPADTLLPPTLNLTIPDEALLDQNGHTVRFYSDLVKGKSVAIVSFFTSCTTVCPTLTATMARTQDMLLQAGRDDIQLISISVDPLTDTPRRLKAWSHNFGAKPGWTFVTGKKASIDKVLKSLKSFTPIPKDHSPMILVGNEPEGVWKQVYGLSAASDLYRAIVEVAGPRHVAADARPQPAASKTESSDVSKDHAAARNYFTDVALVDHLGRRQRLYTDLMQGKVVIINSFFASCTGVCPVMAKKLKEIRKTFSDRIGKDLFVLSISVDPLVDTPERLKEYAKGVRAGPGWLFLTGSKANVETALGKFGMAVDGRENHSNLLLIGNNKTGLWKKAFGLAASDDLRAIVESVLNDTKDSTY